MGNKYEEMIQGYEKSIEQFNYYRKEYCGDTKKARPAPVEHILREWATEKENLWEMFGNTLILSKSVTYSRDLDELRGDMENCIAAHETYTRALIDALYLALGIDPNRDIWQLKNYVPAEKFILAVINYLNNPTHLAENRVALDMPEVVINGTRIRIARGQKLIRALGKISQACGLSQDFEKFRIAHSMVLNQAKLSGNLVLSIHPLDFATASDNESGWSSCMSWEQEGCYRMGTVEMMDSPYVICAYLASESVEMDIAGEPWASKKWRAWVIVDKNFIVVNRNYPYDNGNLSKICVDWVKELAEKHFNTTYGEIIENWCNGEWVDINTDYMYNDMGDNHVGCYNADFNFDGMTYDVNISGIPVCMWCGNRIDFDYDDRDHLARSLICEECLDARRCCDCNSIIVDEQTFIAPDGNYYCESCYYDRYYECSCGSTWERGDMRTIHMPVDRDYARETLNMDGWVPAELYGTLCPDCIESSGIKLVEDSNGEYLPCADNSWEAIADAFNLVVDSSKWKALWERYKAHYR